MSGKIKILVVDGDNMFRDLLSQIMISYIGIEPETANGLESAQKKIKKNNYDLVISNLQMETSDAGLRLLKEFKKKFPDRVFFLMSDNFSEQDRENATELSADELIEKPFHAFEIRFRMGKYCS